MADQVIRFEDGAAYEQMMGVWSRAAGIQFIDWIAPKPGLAWVDVGCGNGAFTEVIVERSQPSKVEGVDPSNGQITYASTRPGAKSAHFQVGDAMALPFPDKSFDMAVMALVIFFVPEPAKGLSEMVRVTRPGGTIAAYAWDILNGGFPAEPIFAEMRALGITPIMPPSVHVSPIGPLRQLWADGGLTDIETREIHVTRTFVDFSDIWITMQKSQSISKTIDGLTPAVHAELEARVRTRIEKVQGGAKGPITLTGRANAVKGRVGV